MQQSSEFSEVGAHRVPLLYREGSIAVVLRQAPHLRAGKADVAAAWAGLGHACPLQDLAEGHPWKVTPRMMRCECVTA